VRVYAESSAVLAWLLGDDPTGAVVRVLAEAELVIASELTLLECERVLHRAVALGELDEATAADRRAHLAQMASHWHILTLGGDVLERARRPFPGEPVSTLHGLHLAAALVARAAVTDLALLSLDEELRSAGARLGLPLQPA
jgi:predicted nucleic acid-binding protein